MFCSLYKVQGVFFFVIKHYTGLYDEINFCKLRKDIVLEMGLGTTDSNLMLF